MPILFAPSGLARIMHETTGSRNDTKRQKLNAKSAEKKLRSQSKDITLRVLRIISASSLRKLPQGGYEIHQMYTHYSPEIHLTVHKINSF
jgi:hypothetical protein